MLEYFQPYQVNNSLVVAWMSFITVDVVVRFLIWKSNTLQIETIKYMRRRFLFLHQKIIPMRIYFCESVKRVKIMHGEFCVLCLGSFTKDDPHLAKMLQHTTYTRYEVHQVVNVTEDLKPPSLLWYWCTLTQIWEYGEDRYISLFKLLKNDMIMNDSQ